MDIYGMTTISQILGQELGLRRKSHKGRNKHFLCTNFLPENSFNLYKVPRGGFYYYCLFS